MVKTWELEKIKDWPSNEIRNYIWVAMSYRQPALVAFL